MKNVFKLPQLRPGSVQVTVGGLWCLFLAAFLAALMSSVDSYLNSASTMLANDLYKRFINPGVRGERLLRIGRIITAALVLWGILFALLLSRIEKSGIYAVFQTLMSFLAAPSFVLILTGILWKRATRAGAFSGALPKASRRDSSSARCGSTAASLTRIFCDRRADLAA